MATDKRARKKDARDAALAARRAELRRRQLVRLFGILVVVAAIVVWALVTGGEDEPQEPAAGGDATPAVSETAAAVEGEIACGGEAPPAAAPQEYDAPGLTKSDLGQGVDYRAVIHTSCGDIEMDLLEDKAPESVASFIFLATEGYFDGLLWHRIERDFVIQTGDPNGQNGVEPDGPGYSIPDEFPEKSNEYVFGAVGMANAGPGTTGSQFFIVTHEPVGEPAGLQPLYTIFATVDEASFQVLTDLQSLETLGGNDPVEASKPVMPAYINSIEIIEA
jgi:peptidylprolyl isomerase